MDIVISRAAASGTQTRYRRVLILGSNQYRGALYPASWNFAVDRIRDDIQRPTLTFFIYPGDVIANGAQRDQNHAGKDALQDHNGCPTGNKGGRKHRQIEYPDQI